jgi:hypothetical protein
MNTLINIHVITARDGLTQLGKELALALPCSQGEKLAKAVLEQEPCLIRLVYHLMRSRVY